MSFLLCLILQCVNCSQNVVNSIGMDRNPQESVGNEFVL